MGTDQTPSFGRRVYLALFKIFGPAQVGPPGPPTPINPNDKTVPPGYHLQTITDESGIKHRIAVQNETDPKD
jgi:hypothetical protein